MKKELKNKVIAIFEGSQIRRHWDEEKELWYFSVVDVIAALMGQYDHKKAQSYWTTLKNRLKEEGSEVVTKCDQLKMQASDGKYYLTDTADTSIPRGYWSGLKNKLKNKGSEIYEKIVQLESSELLK